MREENGLPEIERAIDKLSRHHIRHIKAYDPHQGINYNTISAFTSGRPSMFACGVSPQGAGGGFNLQHF